VEPEFYRSVYLHPYSGEILAAEDHEAGFFMFILDGHMTLWLGEEIGSHVVNISVLIFLIILVSGLVLWWPKKKNKKKKFSFQWKDTTRWKRKNYDLHSITGFYILLFAFIAAFTGSIMAYDWLQEVIYKTAGGEKSPLFIIPENVSAAPDIKSQAIQPIDRIVTKLQFENPDAASIEVHYPYDETASIYVEVTYQEGVYYSSDYRFFDQYTMEEISTPGLYDKYKEAGFADKFIRMNYDIHVG